MDERALKDVVRGEVSDPRVDLNPFAHVGGMWRAKISASLRFMQFARWPLRIEPRELAVRIPCIGPDVLGHVSLRHRERWALYANDMLPVLDVVGTWTLSDPELGAILDATCSADVELQADAMLDVVPEPTNDEERSEVRCLHPIAHQRWAHRVSRSDWGDLFCSMSSVLVADGLLVKIPPGSAFLPAAARMSTARQRWLAGDLVAALLQLREAADAISRLDPTPSPRNLLRVPPANSDAADLRARRLLAAARDLTHLGPHEGDFTAPITSDLVRMVHTSLAGFIRYAISRGADSHDSFWAPAIAEPRP